MDYIKLIVTGVIGGILALIGSNFLGSGTQTETTAGFLGATAANVTTITNPWVFGKTITQTTTNAATSTLSVGCIQSVATSTATPVRITFSPFNGTSTTQGAVSNFLVAAQYGSCPS